MIIQNYFPTGILFHEVSSSIANQIESLIIPRLNKLEPNEKVHTDYFKSKIINLHEISGLVRIVNQCVKFYQAKTQTNSYQSSIGNYWVQDYTPGDFHPKHNHGRTLLSVVYWVRASEDAGSLIIHDPSKEKELWFGRNSLTNLASSHTSIIPKKGNLVIFPGYLDHEVLPGERNCIRTTIAFNIV